MLEDRQRLLLAVEQEPVGAAQDAHVGADLALVGQQRGVAALPGGEGLDVVGDLPLEEVRDVGAGQEQLAAARAVDDHGRRLGQLVVRRTDGHTGRLPGVDEGLGMA